MKCASRAFEEVVRMALCHSQGNSPPVTMKSAIDSGSLASAKCPYPIIGNLETRKSRIAIFTLPNTFYLVLACYGFFLSPAALGIKHDMLTTWSLQVMPKA